MKKILISWLITISIVILTACNTIKSYVFKTETKDNIELILNTNDGYDITPNVPFTITKNKKMITEGAFIKNEYYKSYVNATKNDSNYKIIESSTKDQIEYIFYSYNDSEFDYVINIKNSKTGIVLTNKISKEEAKKCFNLLTIKLR